MLNAGQAQAPDQENAGIGKGTQGTQAASPSEMPLPNDKDGTAQDVQMTYILGLVSVVSLSAATYNWFRIKK